MEKVNLPDLAGHGVWFIPKVTIPEQRQLEERCIIKPLRAEGSSKTGGYSEEIRESGRIDRSRVRLHRSDSPAFGLRLQLHHEYYGVRVMPHPFLIPKCTLFIYSEANRPVVPISGIQKTLIYV